jgi:hypothetical protein
MHPRERRKREVERAQQNDRDTNPCIPRYEHDHPAEQGEQTSHAGEVNNEWRLRSTCVPYLMHREHVACASHTACQRKVAYYFLFRRNDLARFCWSFASGHCSRGRDLAVAILRRRKERGAES